jgi:FkbM family methyltransferase
MAYRRFADFAAARLLTGTRRVETPLGFAMVVGRAPANRMMVAGTFEPEETAVLSAELESADVYVDIGANVGFYACLARHAGRTVVAFEPQPANVRCLLASLRANGWDDVEVFPLALGERPGVLPLYGASGPSASMLAGWAGYSTRASQLVPVSTLDLILGDRFAGRRMLVKIDVEGAELAVLRGAERLLRREPRPTWMIEVCLAEFHPGGANPDYRATFERFWEAGYEVREARAGRRLVERGDVERWQAAGRTDDGNFNYLFLPRR